MLLPVRWPSPDWKTSVNRALDLDPGSRMRLNALLGRSVLGEGVVPATGHPDLSGSGQGAPDPVEAQEMPSANTTSPLPVLP